MGGRTPPRELALTLDGRGTIGVIATVGLTNRGLPSTRATIVIETIIDGRPVAERPYVLEGGESSQATIQGAFALPRGKHRVGIGFAARYTARGPDAFAGPTTLTAMAVPR
jgi:hypothetical protein